MRYQGGKSRIAQELSQIISKYSGGGGENVCKSFLWELFCRKQNRRV